VRRDPGQSLLPGFDQAERESSCPACGTRGRHVGRRGNLDIYSCGACDLVWEVLDHSTAGPPCARCGQPTSLEMGRGPHFAGARCPRCGHFRWLPKPRKGIDLDVLKCDDGSTKKPHTPVARDVGSGSLPKGVVNPTGALDAKP
jgi:DNA-directed RNA polymerase subunit RPC12/RpoP